MFLNVDDGGNGDTRSIWGISTNPLDFTCLISFSSELQSRLRSTRLGLDGRTEESILRTVKSRFSRGEQKRP